jgi:antitoxin (DNA-binding transcriptional repressor) of toxin-antitoxin stability system
MKKLSVREARRVIGKLDKILEVEGELTVTSRGNPIARVLPIERETPTPSHADLRLSMAPMPRASEDLIRDDRDAR